jgi:hypothetical protein
MSSSDRSDDDGTGPHAPAEDAPPPAPIERSSRGRIVIRSSSHPPRGERPPAADEASGARRLPSEEPGEPREKRDTPAERPRRRRQLRSAELGDRARRDTEGLHANGQRRRSPTSVAVGHALRPPPPAGDTPWGAPPPPAGAADPSAASTRVAPPSQVQPEPQPETLTNEPGPGARLARAAAWTVAAGCVGWLVWRLLSR